MNLLKTSFLSGVATLIRMLSGVVVTKVVAIYGGPAGIATVGQLQSIINMIMLLAGDFLKTAITKYTAQYRGDDEKFLIWSSAIKVILVLSVIFFIALYFFSDDISLFIFNKVDYSYVIKVFSFSLPFFVFNSFFLAIINGQKEIKFFVSVNVASSIVSLLLVFILSYFFGLSGALISYVTNQSIVLLLTVYLLRKKNWFRIENFIKKTDFFHYKKLFKFAVITFFSIMTSTFSILFIRSHIINEISIDAAGFWQAIWSLSQMALTLVTTSLATYLLPTLSEIEDKRKIEEEVYSAIKIVLPIAIFSSTSIYVLRDFIIYVLYTDDFSAIRDLVSWQMVGYVFKVLGWVYGYVLVAKGMVKYTVTTEVIFALLWCSLTVFFVDFFGLIGVIYAFSVNSFLHMITMFILFKFKVN